MQGRIIMTIRFERHMKQEHEMYGNHMELILSIHFLTGEPENK